MTQGGESNHSGDFLEQMVEREFDRRKIPMFLYAEKGENLDFFENKFVLKRVPYTSIYGSSSFSEFLYRDATGRRIRIICVWQETSGSVDEKFPYIYFNALKAMPEQEIWIVVGGGGARPKAIAWLERVCHAAQNKTIRVMNITTMRRSIKQLADAELVLEPV